MKGGYDLLTDNDVDCVVLSSVDLLYLSNNISFNIFLILSNISLKHFGFTKEATFTQELESEPFQEQEPYQIDNYIILGLSPRRQMFPLNFTVHSLIPILSFAKIILFPRSISNSSRNQLLILVF